MYLYIMKWFFSKHSRMSWSQNNISILSNALSYISVTDDWVVLDEPKAFFDIQGNIELRVLLVSMGI